MPLRILLFAAASLGFAAFVAVPLAGAAEFVSDRRLVTPVSLGPSGATRLQEGQSTAAPFAYLKFCVASPADCRRSASRNVRWSIAHRDLVEETNRRVNRGIRETPDEHDAWQADVSEGDCEDFALTKRRVLIGKGLPPSSLRMAVALTSFGQEHAVLVVRTNVGDFVLDNRTDAVLLPNRTDLTWIKISSAENPRLWHEVQ